MANQLTKKLRVTFQDLGNGGGNTQTVNCPVTPFQTAASSTNGILVTSINPKCGSLAVPTTIPAATFSMPTGSNSGLQSDIVVINSSKSSWITLLVTQTVGSTGSSQLTHIPLGPQQPLLLSSAPSITSVQLVSGNTYNPLLAGPVVGAATPLEIVVMG